jgi:two-component system NtrC family sensor kinase
MIDRPAAAPPAEPSPDQTVLAATRRLIWTLGLPVLILLAVLTALQYRQRMDEAEQAVLLRLEQRALDLEQLVRPAADHVQDLRALLLARWHDPPDPGPELREALRPRLHKGRPDGVTMDGAPDALRERHGQVWWAAPDGSPPPEDWLRRAARFVEAARVAHQRAPGFEATWFAGTDTNGSYGYPWLPTDRIVQAMGTPGLVGMAPVRAEATASSKRWMQAHAPRTTWWGAPDVSQLHGQLVVSHGAMVVVDGQYVGEVSVDFRLDGLQQRLAAWTAASPGRYLIVNEEQQVVADSARPLRSDGRRWVPGNRREPLKTTLVEHLPEGLALSALQRTLAQPGRLWYEQGWLLAAAKREAAPWTAVVAMPEGALRGAVLASLVPNALIAAALLMMFVAGQWMLSRHFVAPALEVLAYLRGLSSDPATPAPRLEPRWRVWVDAVTEAFRAQRTLQQREQALRERERQREAFNAAIVEWALAAIVATDSRGRIVEFNPAAEAMFGRQRAQMLGLPIATLFPERFRERHVQGLADLVAGERADFLGRRVELTACRADGREFPVELLLWRTEHAGEIHFTASMVDLTERQAAQLEIERQREALRQSEKLGAMGGLLAGVAHELNNPLAVVMGRAGLLEEKLADDAALRADASRIREAAERCGRIVRTFLSMARSKPAQRGPVQLNDLVRAAADMLGYAWRSHGIELQLALAEDLPPVDVDGDQIGQVVLNLLVNAQQALAGRPAPRRVQLNTGLEALPGRPRQAWLRVQDNGPGVPAESREQVFEPFFTTKAEGMGTGLGLAVSRSLARAHGGELMLEPERAGASFRLTLPLAGQPAPALAPEAEQPEAAALARVLVVDDEADIANLMREMLESAGYEVATAESGAVALELLEMARFEAIVSDLRMPDMDGSALWREVRRRHPALARRVLFVTGDTLSQDARQFLDQTGCASLDKPFKKADLLRRVAAVLADGAAGGSAQATSDTGASV